MAVALERRRRKQEADRAFFFWSHLKSQDVLFVALC